MTDYTQDYKNYVVHCCDYWALPLLLNTDLSQPALMNKK